MMFQPKARPEIYPLTGIRALAALWVLLFHLQGKINTALPQLYGLFKPVILNGYLGVDLFFILSGFIISYNYADRFSHFTLSKYWDFLWMRLARLWPVHFVILALYAALLLRAFHSGISPQHPELYSLGRLIQNFCLIQAWSIPIHESWNVPAWSISCEWAAYLLFPAIILSKAVTRSSCLTITTGGLAILTMASFLQSVHANGNNQYGLIRIAGEFVAGCSLCHLFHSQVGRNWNWNLLIPISGVVTILLLGFVLPSFSLVPYWCVPFLALIIFGLAYHQCAYSRLLSTRLFLFGGHISYSLYMVHTLCFIILKKNFPNLEARPMSFVVDLLFAITIAAAMYYFVEEPCRKKMRKFGLLPRLPGKSPDAAAR